MAVTDLHSLDISTPLDRLFSTGATIPGAVLSLVPETPQINIGDNKPLVIEGRAKGQLVHEGGKKKDTSRPIQARPFTTVKLVYSQRVTDEFLRWDAARQGDFVSRLVNDWVMKSMPRDIDTVVLHGVDPSTGTVDTQLTDYVRKTGSSILVPSTGTTADKIDADFATAVTELEGQNITGIAISGKAAMALSTVMQGSAKKYPELGVLGLTGNVLAGRQAASTPEVGQYGETKLVMGDWSQLLLGFAGMAEWKTIEYGDPDNSGTDLQGSNQVCIRLETFFGHRVLDPKALAVVCKNV